MKKKLIISLIVILVLIAAAAAGFYGWKKSRTSEAIDANSYVYPNDGLGFSLTLPPEFVYYQTQRKELPEYTELAIFVPTADTIYQQEVAGYAKPVTVEIYKKENWDKLSDAAKKPLYKAGEKGGRVYAILFWQRIPVDWTSKWSDGMKSKIESGFKLK